MSSQPHRTISAHQQSATGLLPLAVCAAAIAIGVDCEASTLNVQLTVDGQAFEFTPFCYTGSGGIEACDFDVYDVFWGVNAQFNFRDSIASPCTAAGLFGALLMYNDAAGSLAVRLEIRAVELALPPGPAEALASIAGGLSFFGPGSTFAGLPGEPFLRARVGGAVVYEAFLDAPINVAGIGSAAVPAMSTAEPTWPILDPGASLELELAFVLGSGQRASLGATVGLRGQSSADLNLDGVVNGADLGLLLAAWGRCGHGDLNHDGVIDGADLGVVLASWTPDG